MRDPRNVDPGNKSFRTVANTFERRNVMDKEFNYIVSSSETVRRFPSKISNDTRCQTILLSSRQYPEQNVTRKRTRPIVRIERTIVNIPLLSIFYFNQSLRFVSVNFSNRIQASIFSRGGEYKENIFPLSAIRIISSHREKYEQRNCRPRDASKVAERSEV